MENHQGPIQDNPNPLQALLVGLAAFQQWLVDVAEGPAAKSIVAALKSPGAQNMLKNLEHWNEFNKNPRINVPSSRPAKA